ncbi:glycogen synthase [Actinocatenispora sera]|uniref:glycogen synthase n=1 Tax=Actinocatenispora sera TaxID=390989 RepID=UPI0033F99C92
MRVAMLTNEYPPEIYGGAGVHVDFLVRELRRLVEVDVHCFGADRPDAAGYRPDDALGAANAALRTLSTDLRMTAGVEPSVDLVHSHTWYANLAGHLAKLLYDRPHVVTAHSLEPLRPWKAEQLGGGYALSSWAERTAYLAADAIVAVSAGMRDDVLASYPQIDPDRVQVIHNGIDTELYQPRPDEALLRRHGIDPDRPYVLYVGRITRQKGLPHLLGAAVDLDPSAQLVLAAAAPDTDELAAEVATAVEELDAHRGGTVWLDTMLSRAEVITLLSHATVFCCPSVYEPLGIVNLEAMACETAVVASDVGGIPEVVDDGETGLLVHYDAADPDGFEARLAIALNTLLTDPDRAAALGRAGRERAVAEFGWDAIAARTVELYRSLL